MEESRKNLKSVKQKRVLNELLALLSNNHPDLYYQATTDIALMLWQEIQRPGSLHPEQFKLVNDLNQRDIQIILSLH